MSTPRKSLEFRLTDAAAQITAVQGDTIQIGATITAFGVSEVVLTVSTSSDALVPVASTQTIRVVGDGSEQRVIIELLAKGPAARGSVKVLACSGELRQIAVAPVTILATRGQG